MSYILIHLHRNEEKNPEKKLDSFENKLRSRLNHLSGIRDFSILTQAIKERAEQQKRGGIPKDSHKHNRYTPDFSSLAKQLWTASSIDSIHLSSLLENQTNLSLSSLLNVPQDPNRALSVSLNRKGFLLLAESRKHYLSQINKSDPQIRSWLEELSLKRQIFSHLLLTKPDQYAPINLLENQIGQLEEKISRQMNEVRLSPYAKTQTITTPTLTQIKKIRAKKKEMFHLLASGANKKQLKVLKREIIQLKNQMKKKDMDETKKSIKRSSEYPTSPVEQLLSSLEPQQILVDFFIYKPVKEENKIGEFITSVHQYPSYIEVIDFGEPRIIALLAENGRQSIRLVELGELKPITDAIRNYRSAIKSKDIKNPTSRTKLEDNMLRQSAHQLYDHIWQPLERFLKDKSNILVILDGILHIMPIKAIQSQDGSYLLEKHNITMLTSAKDILFTPPNIALQQPALFVGPLYGPGEHPFAFLPEALGEGYIINEMMQESYTPHYYDLDQATETVAMSLVSPRILHFATHGFFFETKDKLTSGDTIVSSLAKTGLALSGANLGYKGELQPNGSDGILSALEVLSMDLKGTELVVLSACDTGLGEIEVGEGIYNLNRAFQQAGAKNILSSLWLISDGGTSEFMKSFYKWLLMGKSPQQAMQATQVEFIKHSIPKYRDPYYWAAFTLSGL